MDSIIENWHVILWKNVVMNELSAVVDILSCWGCNLDDINLWEGKTWYLIHWTESQFIGYMYNQVGKKKKKKTPSILRCFFFPLSWSETDLSLSLPSLKLERAKLYSRQTYVHTRLRSNLTTGLSKKQRFRLYPSLKCVGVTGRRGWPNIGADFFSPFVN